MDAKKTLALAVAATLSHAVSAEQSSPDETFVVTAHGVAQNAASVLAPLEVVTRDDIDRLQAQSLTDVLKTLPGIEIGQNGGRGQVTSLFVRGAESNHVLVLVDGVRMVTSATTPGTVDFNQLPLVAVERVEFIRGARAVTFGSEAIAGVINIITRSEFGDTSKVLEVGGGSFDSYLLGGRGNFAVGENGQLKLAASYEDSDGYNARPTETNQGDKHGFESKNAFAAYEHRLAKQWTAYFSGLWYENEVEFESFGLNATRLRSHSLSGAIAYDSEQWLSELKVGYSNQTNKTYAVASGIDNFNTYADISQYNIAWSNAYQFNRSVKLIAGAEWSRQEIGDDYISYGSAYDVAGRSRNNFGLMTSLLLEHDALTFELGGRWDDNSEYGDEATWAASAGYWITDNTQLIAMAGTAFKAPTMSDLYGYGGNPDLNPESSKNYELGARGVVANVDWRVSAYEMRIDELVDSVCDEFWNCTSQNIEGESKLRGIEFDAGFNTFGLEHRAIAEFRNPKDKDGNQLPRRAKRVFKWDVEYGYQDFSIGALLTYQSERPNSGYDTIILDSYSVTDLRAAYQFGSASLEAKVVNLFDKDYETASGYQSAERSYWINLRYQL
ncbi:TonB-dependent receptor domain-containing protein [Aliagarivorans marinus]|uniref:TonB-dependent receptor domain-containing protein n=1 Tax=Aliagarivorans marinus TaxID=561965 RepID=UPI0004032943|nr:TonB-dependent receptor [Aliagarivorans marinus]